MKNKKPYLVPFNRTYFHESIENAGRCITEDTRALGFFVLKKDGTVTSGVSHDENFTISQLRGACETMKEDLIDMVFFNEQP